jgi:hypothetical protein
MAKPESVFWQQIKKNIKGISFTRLESWASLGVPDTKSLDPCALKLYGGTIKLYKGSRIMELKEKGLKLDACCLGLEACNLYFQNL